MPATAMFSKFKHGGAAQNTLDTNPIVQFFEVGKQTASAGPELVWKIHDGYRKSDGKEVSVFLFEKRCAEKLHKPKRKETVTELLRGSVRQLERFRHPKILQVLHGVEECADTLAFACEPVFASLANVLSWQEWSGGDSMGVGGFGVSTIVTGGSANPRPAHAREYHFLDMELKYGLLQNYLSKLFGEFKPAWLSYRVTGFFPIYFLASVSVERPSRQHRRPLTDEACKRATHSPAQSAPRLRITEALSFLHYSGHVVHRNVCPSSILVTKKGTWKLAGLEFTERVNDLDGLEPVPCHPWTSRLPKMAQPDLDYIAPEMQSTSTCSILSDMFSLGLVICTTFNQGRQLIQANHSSSAYVKQLELLEEQVSALVPKIPVPLQEATVRLLNREARQRPTAQFLSLIKYFSDPAVHALQFLDVINMKDPTQKNHFYRSTLKDVLLFIPKKLWFQHIWPSLQQEMKTSEVLAAVLQPIIFLIQECTAEEYEAVILPSFRIVFSIPKTIQATVTLLENLHVILEKTPREDIRSEVLPMLFHAFESATIQVQSAALVAVTNVSEYLDEGAIRAMVLPKTKAVYEKNPGDLKITMNVLSCVEKTLDRLDKAQIIDEVLPLLWDVRLQDPEITLRVVNIYRLMLSDKKYGLSVNLMATRVMPSLLPQTVNPSLNLEQFTNLLEVLQEMLDHIDRNQRNKLKLDNLSLPSPDRHRPLRHQYSSDNMHVAPFNIPNLRIEQRKTSSAEDMVRKNSTGTYQYQYSLKQSSRPSQAWHTRALAFTGKTTSAEEVSTTYQRPGGWWFGASPSSPDSNFLRVHNAFPNRRLSDNALMMPPKIRIAPSCASSPGGTPGGGLPIRRHSSIGPQERRGSTINLSPPTGLHYSSVSREGSSLSVPSAYGGSMPNTSSSVPFLLSSSMTSIRSRRPSACLSSSQGSGLLQQLGSGMVRQLTQGAANGRAFPSSNYQLFSGRT